MRTVVIALAVISTCSAGEKAQPVYERGVITQASGFFAVFQTECCDYTIYNHYTFGGLNVGGSNPVSVQGSKLSVMVGKKSAKVSIVKSVERPGYDPTLVVVFDPDGSMHRAFNIERLPEGWEIAVRNLATREMSTIKTTALPDGFAFIHGIAGVPFPPIVRFTSK
jgi:hypothetical protein